jgi:TolB protein
MKRLTATLIALIGVLTLWGCGGGGSNVNGSANSPALSNGSAADLSIGPFTTRTTSTLSAPVTAAGSGAVVTGVAGGTISSLVLNNPSPTLADTQIAFISNRSGHNQIYVMNQDGTNQTQLYTENADDTEPAWSPDGSTFAYSSTRNGGGAVHQLCQGHEDMFAADDGPSWSPDGKKIAFECNQGGIYQIYVLPSNAAKQVLPPSLTSEASGAFNPSWSPDGSKIAYFVNNSGQDEIKTMNADGSNQTPLTVPPSGSNDQNPHWSPDGTKIAFSRQTNNQWQVWVINADGSNLNQLTTNGNNLVDSWSPDGSKIVFSSDQDGLGQGYTMNADGSSQTRLTYEAFSDSSFAWSPFVRKKTLVGTGSRLGASASGFLFGQSGNDVTSLVVFNATTPSTAVVSAQTGIAPGIPNIVFSVSADSLKALSYVNGMSLLPVTVIGNGGSAASATGALVSFNAANGQVSAMLPYTETKAVGNAPTVTTQGSVRILRGHFLGVWDSAGKNQAVNGASDVRIAGSTEAILSVRSENEFGLCLQTLLSAFRSKVDRSVCFLHSRVQLLLLIHTVDVSRYAVA